MRRFVGTIVLAMVCLWVPGCRKMADWLSQDTASVETTTQEGNSRPVKRRLCAMVIIGNLGEEDFVEEPVSVTETSSGKLASILNDPNLSEEEKDQKIKELIDQQKARLAPSELQELEKKKTGQEADDAKEESEIEGENPSESMSDTVQTAPKTAPTPAANHENDPLKGDGDVSEETKAEAESLFMGALTRGMEAAAKPAAKPAEATLETVPVTPIQEDSKEAPKVAEAIENKAEEEPEAVEEEKSEEEPEEETEEIDMSQKVVSEEPEEEAPVKTPLPQKPESHTIDGLEVVHQTFERQVEDFLELNKNVPKGVEEVICKANFQNYSIWIGQSSSGDYYAVRYLEYVGENFNVDYLIMTRSPEYKKWMKAQQPYLRQMSSSYSLDVWLEMSEVWHSN